MSSDLDGILDDLFHGCAFAASVELCVERKGLPDAESTRRLAFRYYEEELARRNRLRDDRSQRSPDYAELGGVTMDPPG